MKNQQNDQTGEKRYINSFRVKLFNFEQFFYYLDEFGQFAVIDGALKN